MDRHMHWEHVYQTKAANAVSWYRPHLEKSLELIRRSAIDLFAAIETARKRLGERANPVTWLTADITDPAMLDQVKEGDKVKFHVEKMNGALTITKIEAAK